MADINILAVNGGKKARTRKNPPMFPGGMLYGKEEEKAVLEVLRSKRLFRYYGPNDNKSTVSKTDQFEAVFARETGVKYSLGMNSCTNALAAALVAAGVQPGDEVIIPAYTFVATPAAVVAANAIPVIVEVDDTLTMDPADAEKNITSKTRVLLPVHMRGAPCQMDELSALAKKRGLKLVEDAAQANGGSYKGRMLGSIGDIGCFSLQYHKIITTGEGGMLTTNDAELLKRAQTFHDTGANWRGYTDHSETLFPGWNFRMSEIQGALGIVQLGRRAGIIAKMRGYKSELRDALKGINGVRLRRLPDEKGDCSVCLMFFLETPEKAQEIAKALQAEGVEAGTMGSGHDIPDWHVYTHWKHVLNRRGNNDSGFPFTLSDRKYSVDMCPRTVEFLRRCIHLDVNPLWTKKDCAEVKEGLVKVLTALT